VDGRDHDLGAATAEVSAIISVKTEAWADEVRRARRTPLPISGLLRGDSSDATRNFELPRDAIGTFRNQATETVMLMRGSIIGLLMVGGIAMASAQERVVTLPGASANRRRVAPGPLGQEQTAMRSHASRFVRVTASHFLFLSYLETRRALLGRRAERCRIFRVGVRFRGLWRVRALSEMKDEMARVGLRLVGRPKAPEEIARVVTYILAQTKALVCLSLPFKGTILREFLRPSTPSLSIDWSSLVRPRNDSLRCCRTACRPPHPPCSSGVW